MDAIWPFLTDNGVTIGILAGLVALVEFMLKPIRAFIGLFLKPSKIELGPDTIEKIAPSRAKDGPALTTAEFIRIRRELKADLEAEREQADDAEKTQLTARIAELESQIANPDEALAAANKRIVDLEALLEREGNEIAPDRIAEARAALEAGDFSLADDLFAEIEARAEPDIQRAARAACGRGEVAEQEVRWADAAAHYARAARLDPTYDALQKASDLAERSGDYESALRHRGALLVLAKKEGNAENHSNALNEHALNKKSLGRYAEAEALLYQALEIGRETIGTAHPDYATHLNNLALAVEVQGRHAEAEKYYVDALAVLEENLPADHPNLQTVRNNLEALRGG